MARTPKRGGSRSRIQQPSTERQRRYIAKHPGANNPRSKNYDPRWVAKARGHAPKGGVPEHVSRRAAELQAGITNYQRGKVDEFVDQMQRDHYNPDLDEAEMKRRLKDAIRTNGFDRFNYLKSELRRMRSERNREVVRTSRRRRDGSRRVSFREVNVHSEANITRLKELAAEFGLPIWKWLRY